MLSTDYLRQRALYTLQDLVTRYLTEEVVSGDASAAVEKAYQEWLGEVSDSEASEVVRTKPVLLNRPSQGYDYMEAVNSASSVSTPPNEPFESSSLGETVIRVDPSDAHRRVLVRGPKQPSPLKAEGEEGSEDMPHLMVSGCWLVCVGRMCTFPYSILTATLRYWMSRSRM